MDEILADGIVRPLGWSDDRMGLGAGAPWPVPLARLADAMTAQRRVLLSRFAAPPGDPATDALRLAAHHFAVFAAAIAEIALAIAAEKETGLVLAGVPEIEWLRGEVVTQPPSTISLSRAEAVTSVRRPLRRLARIASWSSVWKLPRALLRPGAVAITHNGLLREAAAHSVSGIGFRHADEWLADVSASGLRVPDAAPALDLAETVAAETARAIGVAASIESRATTILASRLRVLMERAWRDLHALTRAHLPLNIWSGTGGYWPARAIGIEVMRRGGTVRRFDHGGGLATFLDPLGNRLIELDVSSEFVVGTERQAKMLRSQVGMECATELSSGRGDPHYRRSPGPVRQRKSRPRVMYVVTTVNGFRRLWPLNISDFVYIDWQLRVARALAELDIDLVFKPHPEGLYHGRPHPLARLGRVETRPFEAVLDDADAVIFDYPSSTTFWVSVASRCPVVLLNAGLAEFDPHIAPAIAERIAMVPVHPDSQNRPQFDAEALAAAIFAPRPFDHTPFRSLLAGDSAAC